MKNVTTAQIQDFAANRETCDEIAQAILEIAANDDDAQCIWEDPTAMKMADVINRAWELVSDDEDTLYWGEEKITR